MSQMVCVCVLLGIVLRNIPPIVLYMCRNKKQSRVVEVWREFSWVDG